MASELTKASQELTSFTSNPRPSLTDVDFLKDMSDLIGHGSELISGLGDGMTDSFGAGYDVITSAKVNIFATGSN